MPTPSLTEDLVSQLPALKLLMQMGWEYLPPEEALKLRDNRSSQVLLEPILLQQLNRLNQISYRGESYAFTESNLKAAVQMLKDLPVQEGYMKANQAFYDLVTLGESLEQTVAGDKKSFSLKFIDWENPQNNRYHVTEEYSVSRNGLTTHYRPDIVLFINGIPLVVIECKTPGIKEPVEKAIAQHLRNQLPDGITELYQYSNLLMALAGNAASYGTTGTSKEFWSVWKELYDTEAAKLQAEEALQQLKDQPLPENERNRLFRERFLAARRQYDRLEKDSQLVTEQDRLVYVLCQPARLLELILNFTLYDNGEKIISRYQQYFAVNHTLQKITRRDAEGKRQGGVIWHTQGSGKSLTMVMLAQLLAKHPAVKNPKIVLVTDRVELDDQITDTFRKCDVPVLNADRGASREIVKKLKGLPLSEQEQKKLEKTDHSLLNLLHRPGDAVVTTTIHKFETAVKEAAAPLPSPDIFVLVDEGHRSQYGSFNVKMQQAFPYGCFVAFTGTPLMKKEKSTAGRFGGIIDVYSIKDAVADGAVVPLLYEGRHNNLSVNAKPLDDFFEKVAEPLTAYGKANLKRKFSTKQKINDAQNLLEARAWDISEHFEQQVKGIMFGTRFAKAQLVTASKTTAIKYREALREIGKVSSEVLISAPDLRENHQDAYEETSDVVIKFWKAMMQKYGNATDYEKHLVSAFKNRAEPEIIIVVDKLLTGFDAPNNYVLYITRALKEHTLLQAIARVNRLAPGKEHGLIIDYYGNLVNLDSALQIYGGEEYDEEDLSGTVTNLNEDLKKLPGYHADLWGIFTGVSNKDDVAAYENVLRDDAVRHEFYEKLSLFTRTLQLALGSLEFTRQTPVQQVEQYKQDAKFFLKLRVSVKRINHEELPFADYEPQVKKLIDKHIVADAETLKITRLVNIFDEQEREQELEKISGQRARADHIASRTLRAINIKMEEDEVFYQKLSALINRAIDDFLAERISEAEYLKRMKEAEDRFHNKRQDGVPAVLEGEETARAIYNHVQVILEASADVNEETAASIALALHEIIKQAVIIDGIPVIDWVNKTDVEGVIRRNIDDYLYDLVASRNLAITEPQMDLLMDKCMAVAKSVYG